MINAVFNHRNFWDLRAQNLFNGVNPFGKRDANAFLYRADDPSNPQTKTVSLDNSSLASQAVGPPTNRFEMSADGRTFPEVGESVMGELDGGSTVTGPGACEACGLSGSNSFTAMTASSAPTAAGRRGA